MTHWRVLVALIAALVVVGFGVWFFFFQEPKPAPYQLVVAETTDEVLHIRSSVTNNTVTYSGSVPLLGACDTVSAGISATGTNPLRVVLALSVVRPTIACEITELVSQEFSVSYSDANGIKKAELGAVTINGEPADYKVVNE